MRYTPHTDEDIKQMLEAIGVETVDELFRSIPADIQQNSRLDLPHPLSEMEALELAGTLAARNYDPASVVSFLGGGSYDHYVPAAVDQLISRSEFYTCYTPYQAEVSQGTLQAIYEYQSLICRLTGMDISNASGYDGASVTADAALMASAARRKRGRILVSETVNPAYRRTVETYNFDGAVKVETVRAADGATDAEAFAGMLDEDVACLIVQNPNFYGIVEDISMLCTLAHEHEALAVVSSDPVALGLITSPGEAGADIAVGEGQAFGAGLGFGGPYLGYFACREDHKRQLPGRLVGMTEDSEGREGYVLTLQTREQHIRREKATSNICTNQSLLALAATIHLSLLGKQGVRRLAELCIRKAHYLAGKIAELDGWKLAWPRRPFFKEFVVEPPVAPGAVIDSMLGEEFLAGVDLGRFGGDLEGKLLVAVTEKRTREQMDAFAEALAGIE